MNEHFKAGFEKIALEGDIEMKRNSRGVFEAAHNTTSPVPARVPHSPSGVPQQASRAVVPRQPRPPKVPKVKKPKISLKGGLKGIGASLAAVGVGTALGSRDFFDN